MSIVHGSYAESQSKNNVTTIQLKGLDDPMRGTSSNIDQRDHTTLDAGNTSVINGQGSFNVNVTKHSFGGINGSKKVHNNRDLLGTKEEQQMRQSALTQRPLTTKEEAYVQNLRPSATYMIQAHRQDEKKYSQPYRHSAGPDEEVGNMPSTITKYNYVGVPLWSRTDQRADPVKLRKKKIQEQ